MRNILLISSKPKAFADLVHQLEQSDFRVIVRTYSLLFQKKGVEAVIDFILYDLMPSYEENIRNISHMNKYGTIPIYVFGENISEEQEIAYYDNGANGVVRIPFQPSIITKRLKSVILLLERTSRIINKVTIGEVEIDLHNRVLKKQDEIIRLTNVESKILHILLQNKNTVVDKDAIINFAWSNDDSATDNALGIHIARLRNKVEYDKNAQIIDTIWGIGYRLNYEAER